MTIEVIAVVGACAPERHRYACWLASHWDAGLVSGRCPGGEVSAVSRAVAAAHRNRARQPVIVEYPLQAPVLHVIGEIVDGDEPAELTDLICVVDATHLLADLASAEQLRILEHEGQEAPVFASRAELMVTQIEYASVVVLVNTECLDAPGLNMILSLVSHLAPKAYLDVAQASSHRPSRNSLGAFGKEQTHVGWLSLLNDDYAPRFEDPEVVAVRYEQLRPMHPGRFAELIERYTGSPAEASGNGRLVRSAGFVHLASRSLITAYWNQVGPHLTLTPACVDDQLTADDEPLALGQDLVLLGLGADPDRMAEELDTAALTDRELIAGPMVWDTFDDPFPGFSAAHH